MGIKDKERRNEYERKKWRERREAKLLALGLDPIDFPVGGENGAKRQIVIPGKKKLLPAEIRRRKPGETEEEYKARYNRDRINHWNARNREHVAELARANYSKNHDTYRAAAIAWDAENPEKVKAYQKKYYHNNKEKRDTALKAWAKNNPERYKESQRAWAKENRAVFNQASARYRAKMLQAAPPWLDWKVIWKIYSRSANHNKAHPNDKWQVDHIIPLNHPEVCGLHVPWNLQTIPVADNQRKGNRWLQEHGVAPMT